MRVATDFALKKVEFLQNVGEPATGRGLNTAPSRVCNGSLTHSTATFGGIRTRMSHWGHVYSFVNVILCISCIMVYVGGIEGEIFHELLRNK
jgi:hypothetical protein